MSSDRVQGLKWVLVGVTRLARKRHRGWCMRGGVGDWGLGEGGVEGQ